MNKKKRWVMKEYVTMGYVQKKGMRECVNVLVHSGRSQAECVNE